MKIKELLSQHRNDFTALIECESCEHVKKLLYGYNDANYHDNVLPNMKCEECGKSRRDKILDIVKQGER